MRKIVTNQQLKFVDLSHNKISKLPHDFFSQMLCLVKLNLDYNNLKTLPMLSDKTKTKEVLKNLACINVTNNFLVEFPISLFVKADGT